MFLWLAACAHHPAALQLSPDGSQLRRADTVLLSGITLAGTPESAIEEVAPGHHRVAVSHGDGCPVMYRMVCPTAVSEAFGNCEEPVSTDVSADHLVAHFDSDLPSRGRQTVTIARDSCAVTVQR